MQKILLIIFSTIIFLGCEEKIQPSVLQNLSSTNLPSQESWNTKITFTDSAKVKAILHAGHISTFDNSKTTQLDNNVRVDFYDPSGKHTSVLTALSGTIDENTNNLEAKGNVVFVSDDNVKVKTEKLLWNNQKQLVHSNEFVTITTPTEQLQGHGFESDQNLRNYRIFKVTGKAETKN